MRHALILLPLCPGRCAHARARGFGRNRRRMAGLRHRQPSRQRRRRQMHGEIHQGWRRLLRGFIALRHRDRPLRGVGTRERRGRKPLLRLGGDQRTTRQRRYRATGQSSLRHRHEREGIGPAEPVEIVAFARRAGKARIPHRSGNQAGLRAFELPVPRADESARGVGCASVTSIGTAYILYRLSFRRLPHSCAAALFLTDSSYFGSDLRQEGVIVVPRPVST